MSSKITFTQSIQLWWRFALILSGVLIFTSIFTRIILWLSAAITHILSLTPTDANPETYQHIHPLLLHAVCLISISVFILAQIFAIYALVNYNKKIRSILYTKDNTRKLTSRAFAAAVLQSKQNDKRLQ